MGLSLIVKGNIQHRRAHALLTILLIAIVAASFFTSQQIPMGIGFRQDRQNGADIRPVVRLVYALLGAVWVVAYLATASHFLSEVWRRRREVGLMRAFGGSPERVAALFLFEAGALSLIGSFGGVVLGMAAEGVALHGLTTDGSIALFRTGVGSTLLHAAVSMAVAFGTGMLAAAYPARVAAGIDPSSTISGFGP